MAVHRDPKEAIDLEIARLIDAPKPDNGRRASPHRTFERARARPGLAPGTDVTINVVNPGERTWNLRKNSNMLEICISGEGVATVAGRDIRAGRWDVWNTPAMQVHSYRNEGKGTVGAPVVPNAPLLESWRSTTSRNSRATCRRPTPTPSRCRPALRAPRARAT